MKMLMIGYVVGSPGRRILKEQLPRIYELLKQYEHEKQVIIFKNREEMTCWIEAFDEMSMRSESL